MKMTTMSTSSGRRARDVLRLLAGGACLLAGAQIGRPAAEPQPASAILQELHAFQDMGSVLYIAAHPDDENTQLIAYLARGRHYRTAYLSLTRGDGGQNVLGPEFGEELGVIRTQELLAARRIDGGRQFFTRAIDFGFSKDYRETLRIWNRDEVLSDIVRVIREFRPDVIITRFSTQPGRTHGHHTASAVLALEAFKLAGDPKAFPDQLRGLKPWQPARILWNVGGFQRNEENGAPLIRIDAGGQDPESGESFSEIAARSRSMHKTQGFGNFGGFGRGGGPRPESFVLLAGQPATNDILEGIDTTWNRVPGGADIGRLTAEAVAQFDSANPAASVPALLKLRRRLATLPADPVVDEKRGQLDRILQQCLGLTVTTEVPQAEVVPGENLHLRHTVVARSNIVPVRWVAIRYPDISQEIQTGVELQPGQAAAREAAETLPANTPLSQPYWLREPHGPGMYRVDDPALIGKPENPPVFPVDYVFDIGGQTVAIPDRPVQVTTDPGKGQMRRRLDVIAPVSIRFTSAVRLFAPGSPRPVEVEVTAFRDNSAGTLQLEAPAGWKVAPAKQSFRFEKVGDHARLAFTVTAPEESATAEITAWAKVGGHRYDNGRVLIDYSHIPLQLLQPAARLKAVCLHLAIRGRQVGYVPGAGDSVADSLSDMGCTVTPLAGADLTPERLKGLDAVVIGIRAFNVRTDLVAHLPALFDYARAGGTVIVQYNRPRGLQTDTLAPFELHLSNERVTDEDAPVTFLAPDHPALNTPNKITQADFEGWIQERGVYFPDRWDEHFTPILACSDPGEAPLRGGLLVARDGKGYYVYTGLVWFRQLPAGVPGAYRLFANLVSLGKSESYAKPEALK
jgi:LmbE family N-acetylglucosaminyl deacetylase